MSIINQTLRELDARQSGSGSPRVPLRPAAASFRSRPGLRVVGGVLLPIAGLMVWAMFRPAETLLPQAQPGSAQRAVASHAALPAASAPSAVMAAPPPVVVPAQALASPQPEIAPVESPLKPPAALPREHPEAAKATGVSGMSLKMKLSTVAESAPAIRKEANKPTADEEADDSYRKAAMLLHKGRESQARPLLEEAIRLSPGHVAARQTLATLLSEAGQNGEAEAVLRAGRAAAPDNAWFALSLARLQAARGDAEGAAATLLGGIDERGVNAEYHATLAALLVRLNRHPEAAHQYERALKLQPDQGTWWMGLGISMESQGKSDEARSAYGRALKAGNLPDKLAGFVRAKLAE